MKNSLTRLAAAAALFLTWGALLTADTVRVRHLEGLVHGFLVLRDATGNLVAHGQLEQVADRARVRSRLMFNFDDGSVYDETAVFSQSRAFRLVRDELNEHGPSFPRSIDMTIDVASQRVRVMYSDEGKKESLDKRIALPADLANGLIPVLLKNVDRGAPPKQFPMVVATPEPRLVTLEIAAAAAEMFSKGDRRRTVTEYTLKPNIGGLKGLLAPLVGKQPADAHVWILEGTAPAFLAAEQQFYPDGPLWRIELSVPQWQEGPQSRETEVPR